MSSTVVVLSAMFFVLVCLAAAPRASAAVTGAAGGILHIPSNASLAHCPSSCGDVDIDYPFGIGSGCFRQGFELTCDNTTQPPKLYFGNTTTQLTKLSHDEASTPMFFNITMGPGVNTYNMSWVPPAKSITIDSDYNTFYVIGCDFDVTLSDYGTGDFAGSCMTRCDGGKLPNAGPCNGLGCCSITLPRALPGFLSTLVRAGASAAQSDQQHPGVMAFMSYGSYWSNASALFSSWTNASKIYGTMLSFAITDQPSCESARTNNTSYACSISSNCRNVPSGGYNCHCPGYEDANPYLLNGCIDYNTKHKEHCPTSCGNLTIPFPFGLEEGCFANERFQLNCTAGNLAVFGSGDARYHVTDVSVEDGTLTVSNMLSDTRSEEEVVIFQTDQNGESVGPVEDQFDFSIEYDIVIKWAVANLTCQMAMQKNSMYACRSAHSDCLNVTHKKIFLGYRCKCSSGFQGNPYLQDGCIDVDECSLPNYCNGTCQNFSGGYKCTSCPHRKEFDLIKRKCVTSAKQRNLLLGIAIGIGCGLGSIIIALGGIVLANKWKKGIQKRIRRAYC